MAAAIECHFDFISPFAFFAARDLPELAVRHGRTIDWRIMSLGVSVIKVMGLKALVETPLKGDYLLRFEIPRWCRQHGVRFAPVRTRGVFSDTRVAGQALCWIAQHQPDRLGAYVRRVLDAYWLDGLEVYDSHSVGRLAGEAGCDADALTQALAGGGLAMALRRAIQASLEAGVFGSPTFIIDGEMFWGYSTLPQVDRWLETGGW